MQKLIKSTEQAIVGVLSQFKRNNVENNQSTFKNSIDSCWVEYNKTKNKSYIEHLSSMVLKGESNIDSSKYFGKSSKIYFEEFDLFFNKKISEFNCSKSELLDKSNTFAHTIGLASIANQAIEEIVVTELNTFADAELNENLIKSIDNLFNLSPIEKVKALSQSKLITENIEMAFHGSLFFDASFVGVSFNSERAFLLSLQTPVDALYLPNQGLVLCSQQLSFEVKSRVEKLLKAYYLYPFLKPYIRYLSSISLKSLR